MVREFGGYETHPFVAEFYDLNPAYSERRDVGFFVEEAVACGGPVLELGCGTGRVLIPTADAGVSITGLDLSTHMLHRCCGKLDGVEREVRERTRLVEGDMTDFDLGETFALVTVPFRPFQHLVSVESQLACVRCANRHLRPGGRLILDLFHPRFDMLTGTAPTEEAQDFPEVQLADGRRFRRTHRFAAFHKAEQYNSVELIYYVTNGGTTERHVQAFPFRYFFRYEVEHLLERAGFRVTDLYGDYDRSPLRDDSPEMVFVAEKRADA